MEMNQYLSMFIDESREHLQAMNQNLLSLENTPNDVSIVQSIFRSAHTLKGMSATMGFDDIAALTHEMENVLDLVRSSKLSMNSLMIDCIFRSLDSLESMVEDIIQGGTGKADNKAVITSLAAIVSGDYLKAETNMTVKTPTKEAEKNMEIDDYQFSILQQSLESGFHVFYIDVGIREDCVLKAVRAYMVFDVLEGLGEVVKSTPSAQDIEQEKFDRSFSLFYISTQTEAELEKQILNVSEIETAVILAVDQDTLNEMVQSSRVSSESQAAAAIQETAAASATSAVFEGQVTTAAAVTISNASAAGGAPAASRTIRVDIERLDALMNLFSELLIDRARLEQLAGEVRRNDLTDTVEHMSRVSSDLQNIVLKLRMVPIDSVFNRFPRMIRDLAKSLDKKVDLIISGADTELDRTVIDEIGDPLVHLLRNSIDHGVESIQERLAAGKKESGTIQLRAFHSGNHVFIEIEDDGKGINRDIVLNKAMKNGLVSEDQASKLSDADIFQLLFESGFSTADKISDISGRGVGLDVVKTKIHTLGGHVHVESKPGMGSKFSVQLPLTLSIISAMLVQLGKEKYAIPLSSIVETSIIVQGQIRHIQGNRMIDYRKSVIPLVSLSQLFDVPDYDDLAEDEIEIVVVRKGEKQIALMVDEFIGQQEIVLKALGRYLTGLFAISGATILGDGQVALIIDTNALIK